MPALPGTVRQRGEKALSQHQPLAAVSQRVLQGRNPLCCIRVRRHRPALRLTPCPVLPGPPTSSGCSSPLRVLAGHPRCRDASSCGSMAGGDTNTHPAHPHGPFSGGTLPPPQHPPSLSPPACFLRFRPYFSRQKQPPPSHLPSLSRSQLFFLLFSASYYPGAKNNKEFTALDLELGEVQGSSFVLCQQITPWLILGFPCISSSPFPWGHGIGTLADGNGCQSCCELVTSEG